MSEGSSGSTGKGRPKLPPAALERIRQGEKVAIETLQKAVQPYTPANPNSIYQPSEINAGCWKVIDHLAAFAETIFDIQGCEYADLYPEMVQEGGILVQEIGPEVVERTKRFWTKWETLVDLSLRARWTTEYYNAYVQDANKPGSEDEKLMQHFVRRLEEAVAERIVYWQKRCLESDPSHEGSSVPSLRVNEAAASTHGAHPTRAVKKRIINPRVKVGRRQKDQTRQIADSWEKMGCPEITATVCDKIGKQFFAEELKESRPGSSGHKRVRERVRKAIERSGANPQHNYPRAT
jgi:hypothetical protein